MARFTGVQYFGEVWPGQDSAPARHFRVKFYLVASQANASGENRERVNCGATFSADNSLVEFNHKFFTS